MPENDSAAKTAAPKSIEVSVVVESYNHEEGAGTERLALTLQAATAMAAEYGRAEVLLTDVSDSLAVAKFLEHRFRSVKRVDAAGLRYDAAKARAGSCASGQFLLYLDGDCLPDAGWIESHLALLRDGKADATGGFTRYEGGFLAALCTVMDFGFLLPRRQRTLSCYASNNCGFKRQVLAEAPVPESSMRCNCYAHA